MSTINVTTDTVFDYLAGQYINQQYADLSAKEKGELKPLTKANLKLMAFNASTVLLTIAAAYAVFSTMATAAVLGGVALCLRLTVQKELDKALGAQSLEHGVISFANDVLGAFGIRGQIAPHWNPNRVVICGHSLWKNLIAVQ